MNIKSEKGVTGIDIASAILIITIFIALITNLSYSINSNNASIERKTKATHLAISLIENIKSDQFEKYKDYGTTGNIGEYEVLEEGYIDDTPFYKKVSIIDFANMEENQDKDIKPNIIKRVTLEISYKEGNKTENVKLSTLLNAKE